MKILNKIIIFCSIIGILMILTISSINEFILMSTKNFITSEINDIYPADCILVLGAGVWNNDPSPMLKDRLEKAIELYFNHVSAKVIMSGDHSSNDYDEVNVMKSYAISKGIPSENVFMDHAGFSTYDSIYRALKIFQANKIIIVSQEYHLSRALYLAHSLGIEAIGVPAEDVIYSGQTQRELREVLARTKDFVLSILKPYPKYLGETIPVFGDGNVTND